MGGGGEEKGEKNCGNKQNIQIFELVNINCIIFFVAIQKQYLRNKKK